VHSAFDRYQAACHSVSA